jgi:N-acetyl-anhydromuramyl-L-alanine amidase AmpD
MRYSTSDQKSFLFCCIWSVLLIGCGTTSIIQKPIPFDFEREQLSIQYLEKRHGIKQAIPSIQPKMVVVHYTVIPTMERTYNAFVPSILPNSRTGIKSASSLNVSSQYLIDRDGTIYQLLPDTVFARHVIGLNYCAIGIENVANGKDLPLTKKQMNANVRLIRKLTAIHDIEYLIGHHEYQDFIGHPLWKETDPNYLTKKSDPGDVFMIALRHKLKSLGLKGPPKS